MHLDVFLLLLLLHQDLLLHFPDRLSRSHLRLLRRLQPRLHIFPPDLVLQSLLQGIPDPVREP